MPWVLEMRGGRVAAMDGDGRSYGGRWKGRWNLFLVLYLSCIVYAYMHERAAVKRVKRLQRTAFLFEKNRT